MTNNIQEIDEILGHWIKGYINGSASGFYVTNQTKQDILDWHNKQIEAVLDRLEGDMVEMRSKEYGDGLFMTPNVIEAERNKLKESSDDKDS